MKSHDLMPSRMPSQPSVGCHHPPNGALTARSSGISFHIMWLYFVSFWSQIQQGWSRTSSKYRVAILFSGILLLLFGGWRGWSTLSSEAASQQGTSTPSAAQSEQPDLTIADLPPYNPSPDSSGGVRRDLVLHTVLPDRPRLEVQKYIVKEGDTLFGIAEGFGLKAETLLWGNFEVLEDNPHSLRPGQELNILPIDGTYYQWKEGDSLEDVANFFGVPAREILDWPGNDINPADLQVRPGTWLVVPGGKREFVTWRAPRITRANPAVASVAGPGSCGAVYDGPIGEGYFVWPTTAGFLSGYGYSSFHPGIDIAGSMGNAIYAAASGVVVYAGWNNYGYGYMVVIDHGDGWQSLYAHMSNLNVGCGQAVFQGGVIGGVGSSGNSSGPHLHFELQSDAYGKVNPYDFVSP